MLDSETKHTEKRKKISQKKIKQVFANHLIKDPNLDSTTQKLLFSLMKEPNVRTAKDLEIIKKFLESSDLAYKFKSDNLNQESLDKMLSMCSQKVRYSNLDKRKILFRIGDIGDNFYLIVSGRIGILKPVTRKTQMTGFEYFRYLMNLYQNNEKYLLNLIIEENKLYLEVNPNDISILNEIVLKMILEEHFSGNNYVNRTIKEILYLCCVDRNYFNLEIDYDLYKTDTIYHSKIENQILNSLPKFSHELTQKYRILSNNQLKFKVIIYEYKSFLELGKGSFFGDCALDKETTRNATIQAVEDTHFCYLDYHHYNCYLKLEKQRLNTKEINFLKDNFIYRNIPFSYFEKKIFNSFIYEEKVKDDIIFRENENVDCLYFIKEGIIELTINKSIIDIYHIATYLSKLNFHRRFPVKEIHEYPTINQMNKDEYINHKTKNKIFFLGSRETMGCESFFFGLNYLYTARVASETVKFYKMEINTFIKTIQEDKDSYLKYEKVASKKIEIFLNRIIDLYNTIIKMKNSENQEKLNTKNIYKDFYQTEINKEKNSVKCNGFVNQNKLITSNTNSNEIQDLNPKSSEILITLQHDLRSSQKKNTVSGMQTIPSSIPLIKEYSFKSLNREAKSTGISNLKNSQSVINQKNQYKKTAMSLKLENLMLQKIKNDLKNDKLLMTKLIENNTTNNQKLIKEEFGKNYQISTINDRYKIPTLKKIDRIERGSSQKRTGRSYRTELTLEKMNKYSIFDSGNEFNSYHSTYCNPNEQNLNNKKIKSLTLCEPNKTSHYFAYSYKSKKIIGKIQNDKTKFYLEFKKKMVQLN